MKLWSDTCWPVLLTLWVKISWPSLSSPPVAQLSSPLGTQGVRRRRKSRLHPFARTEGAEDVLQRGAAVPEGLAGEIELLGDDGAPERGVCVFALTCVFGIIVPGLPWHCLQPTTRWRGAWGLCMPCCVPSMRRCGYECAL